MTIISCVASCEATIGYNPAEVLIITDDTLDTILGTVGYLNSQTLIPCGFFGLTPVFSNGQTALVLTSDFGTVYLQVYIDLSSNVSLIPMSISVSSNLMTNPAASSSSSLSLGSDYQNTLGYDVMITVYLSVTSSLAADILLGVGPSSSPTQQTVVSGLTLAALNIVPVNIYLPANYYAKLSTSGTITASITGQICMPV